LNAGTTADIGAYEASSSYLVTSTADSDAPGTLRGALLWAAASTNANPANLSNAQPNTVDFEIPTTDPGYDAATNSWTVSFTPGNGPLDVSNTSTAELIEGPGANLVTINASGTGDVFHVSSGATATIAGLTISGSLGSAISNAGTLDVTGCAVIYNNGGGIDNASRLTVTDSTIANGNSSGMKNEVGATVTFINSTIAGNNGSGIDNFGTLFAVNTTIAYNKPNELRSAGLRNELGGAATLYNSIVALNFGFYDYSDIVGAVSTASSYNLIGTGGSGGLTAANSTGNLLNVASARLAAGLANNGGPTETIALLKGSPAIDAGSSVIQGVVVPTSDQRGSARPEYGSGAVDIGAFESPAFGNPAVFTVTSTSNDPGVAGSLPWAINQANNQANPAGSVIRFDPTVFNTSSPRTITLATTLHLSETSWPEVIQGPGENALTLTIGSGQVTGIVQVGSTTTAAICGLTISGGLEPTDDGGGIYNFGTLTVTDTTIENNISSTAQ
jgi:hypothetical protein